MHQSEFSQVYRQMLIAQKFPTHEFVEALHLKPRMVRARRGLGGFTLIEVMITVAIVGILAAIAYPSYVTYMRKSHRAEAFQLLMNVSSRQQQYLLDTRAYAASLSTLGVSVPSSLSSHYSVSLAVGTATVPAFTVTAAPISAQVPDSCGTLTLNHAGAKTPTNCW